ncbi:hypothetical protein DPEC_G00364060 [Dallia pectoralis]|nr:hypothetical protein DPEC_G00364060 [Dallia pectoralis]
MTEHVRPLLGSPSVTQQSSIVKVAMGRRDPGCQRALQETKARPFGKAECESKRVKVDSQDETNGYDDNGTVQERNGTCSFAACETRRLRGRLHKVAEILFSTRRRSYSPKLVRAFQVVKTCGHPMLTLNSERGLSCYYKLAVAYTTDRPLEMAAACLPELARLSTSFTVSVFRS